MGGRGGHAVSCGPGPELEGRDSAPPDHRAVLALPLIAVLVGLAFAGLMALIREAALFTMPFESIENLRVATTRGDLAAAVSVVGGITVLNGGRRLRDVVAALDGSTGARHRGVVGAAVTVLVEVGLLAVATWRGHGTLSVITALLAGQVALVWAIRWTRSAQSSSGVPPRARSRPRLCAGHTSQA